MRVIFTILLFICFTSYGQITIRQNEIIEKIVQKPKPYDSLINVSYQEKIVDYNQFVGQKIFYIPKSKKYKFTNEADTLVDFLLNKKFVQIEKKASFKYEELNTQFAVLDPNSKYDTESYNNGNKKYLSSRIDSTNIYNPYFIQRKYIGGQSIEGNFYTNNSSVEGKYFTIIDIVSKKEYNDDIRGKYSLNRNIDFQKYIIDEKTDQKLENVEGKSGSLIIKLKNDITNDTLIWKVLRPYYINTSPFILVSYYTKLRNKYFAKNLISQSELIGIAEINTGNEVKIQKGEKWNCTDFSFIDVKDSPILIPFFILKNNKGQEIKLKIKDLENEIFITEEVHIERETKRKLKEEEIKKQQIEEEKRIAKELEDFRISCIKKYGTKLGKLVSDGNVIIGMTKQMCELSWGNPISVNTTTIKGLVMEQWVYNWKNYLYFRNNELTAIQN
ncbi:hypothetical protein [Flavobacterium soyangense]|uniref:Uncharacterized protein n=1 Tax=Flavobacterium soyangense TaxID=2023265 RepID=A0A930UA65_9FLAO|nr:hypothetical protein [Flavobacterium soyangense]MBF2709778.1 hypothetical protein [Flavobacterium soyangense]